MEWVGRRVFERSLEGWGGEQQEGPGYEAEDVTDGIIED
jgi:hypothetical protein